MTKRRVHVRLKEHKPGIILRFLNIFLNIAIEHPKILCNDRNKMRLLAKESSSIFKQSANKSLNVNIKSFECKLW